MSIEAHAVPPLKSFLDLQTPDHLALSRGEVSRFRTQCDALLATLKREEIDPPLMAEDVQRVAVRMAWAFYYARKATAPEEHDKLLAVYLQALDKLHDIWLDVEKPRLIEERVVREAGPLQAPEPAGDDLPRPPEIVMQATRPTDV